MAKDSKIHIPGFGGLVRYDEEYKSKFMLKPEYVIVFIILLVLFATGLRIFG